MKTRKNKVTNFLKTGILFLGVSLLLWNCETENELSQEIELSQTENIISKHITHKEIPKIANIIKSKFRFAKNENTFLNINYDNILEITDSLKAKSYSFKFNRVYNEEYFANIIVQKNNDGSIEPPLVYKYIPTEEFNREYLKGSKDITEFTGEIEMYSLDNFLVSHNNQTQSKNSFRNGGPCGSVNIFGIGNNGYGSTGSGSTGGGTSCEVKTRVISCHCKGDLVGVHDHQATIVSYEVTCKTNYATRAGSNDFPCGRSSGNNNRITVGVHEPPMIPCFGSSNCEEEYISNVLNNVPNLNQGQINWVTNLKNIRTVVKISDFIDENNNSLEAKEFVKSAIEILSLPKLSSNDNIDTFKNRILRMTKHLREKGNPEDEFFADYVESLIPDFTSMNVGDVYDIYKLTKEQTDNLTYKYLQAVVVPVAEAAYPFIVYALTEATLGAALPLLSRIPLAAVIRGAKLNKMVTQLAKLGTAGTSSRIRLIPNSTYTKTLTLFNKITQNSISPVTTTISNGRVIKVANMGNGNYITFRNFDSSGTANLVANIDLKFPAIWSTARELKFIK